MQDEQLQKILNYLRYFPEPRLGMSKDDIQFYSNARSTVLEIVERIVDCPFEATEDILWQFIVETTHYQKIATSKVAKDVFEVMCEIGIELYYEIQS